MPSEITQNPEFRKSTADSIDSLIELSDLEVCLARKNGLGLAIDAAELSERILSLANGSEFIAGVRYKNLDISFPFVEVHLGFDPTNDDIKELSHIIKREFESINPKGFKFKTRPDAYSNLDKWSHTVFGKIAKQESSLVPFEIKFSFSQNLDWHQQYVAEYQERLAEKKELDGFVRIGQLDEFQEAAAADNALLIANDANGFCGVIAGIKSPIYGLPAIYMIESYLSKRWTGKKIAPMAHGIFLNEMANRFKYVWGTIYDKKLSSLNTAMRIGRRIIETEYFVRF